MGSLRPTDANAAALLSPPGWASGVGIAGDDVSRGDMRLLTTGVGYMTVEPGALRGVQPSALRPTGDGDVRACPRLAKRLAAIGADPADPAELAELGAVDWLPPGTDAGEAASGDTRRVIRASLRDALAMRFVVGARRTPAEAMGDAEADRQCSRAPGNQA